MKKGLFKSFPDIIKILSVISPHAICNPFFYQLFAFAFTALRTREQLFHDMFSTGYGAACGTPVSDNTSAGGKEYAMLYSMLSCFTIIHFSASHGIGFLV
jgi:hypothetical protein